MEKFPDLDVGIINYNGTKVNGHAHGNSHGNANGPQPGGVRWTPTSSTYNGPARSGGHSRQKSIGEAIRTIKSRHGSVSQNAHEIADALKAPLSPRLIVLCIIWYGSSALTNTSSKSILNAFAKPATLTLVQFAFVCGYCLLLSWVASIFPALRAAVPSLKHGIRYPSRDVIQTTMPLAAFQIFGHLLSSTATSKIPVSLVHTIKGLSPLFTVLAYRIAFNIRYPAATYLSLVPLTLGVMLACSGKHKFGGEFVGIIYALIATLIFVTQNIFSKHLFNEAARAEADGVGHNRSRKLDKLNLLCYSSGMAFVLTVPIWLWSEGFGIIGDFLHDGSVDLKSAPGTFDHGRLFVEFVFNGTFHFGQNIMAFVLLSMVSPVTYSVASLIKRVFVIVMALVWFRSPTTKVQAVGIALTFVGLYLYDRTKEGNKADKRATYLGDKGAKDSLLPLSTKSNGVGGGLVFKTPAPAGPNGFGGTNTPWPYVNGYALPVRTDGDNKRSDDQPVGRGGRQRGPSTTSWMPPGTKQEDTWRVGDRSNGGPAR